MSKHKRCPECGLKMRGGNVERHEAGIHHIRRKAAIAKAVKA